MWRDNEGSMVGDRFLFIYFYICVKVSVFIAQQGRMNFDIFIRVIDWFVSICEATQQEAMANGREEEKMAIFVGSLPITILEDAWKY